MTKAKILTSQCLYGEKTVRYDGKYSSCEHPIYKLLRRMGALIPVCPEVFGGFPVPHSPSEIYEGRVVSEVGKDVTSLFYLGAERVLHIAKKNGCRIAILKKNSPSCGVNQIYDGKFSGRLVNGQGITTRLLMGNNIACYDEDELLDAIYDYFEGRLVISAQMLNETYSQDILGKFSPYLQSYKIEFRNGKIFLYLDVKQAQVGRLKIIYELIVEEFLFNSIEHKLVLTYQESIKGEGGLLQNAMLAAFKGTNTILMALSKLKSIEGVQIGSDRIIIDLDSIIEDINFQADELFLVKIDDEEMIFEWEHKK